VLTNGISSGSAFMPIGVWLVISLCLLGLWVECGLQPLVHIREHLERGTADVHAGLHLRTCRLHVVEVELVHAERIGYEPASASSSVARWMSCAAC